MNNALRNHEDSSIWRSGSKKKPLKTHRFESICPLATVFWIAFDPEPKSCTIYMPFIPIDSPTSSLQATQVAAWAIAGAFASRKAGDSVNTFGRPRFSMICVVQTPQGRRKSPGPPTRDHISDPHVGTKPMSSSRTKESNNQTINLSCQPQKNKNQKHKKHQKTNKNHKQENTHKITIKRKLPAIPSGALSIFSICSRLSSVKSGCTAAERLLRKSPATRSLMERRRLVHRWPTSNHLVLGCFGKENQAESLRVLF